MPLLPLYDENPTRRITYPWVTWGIMALCILLALGLDREATVALAYVPGDGLANPLTLITYQFVHGGLVHLGLNMLALYIFGDNVEDLLGHVRFAVFFVVCGIGAALIDGVVMGGAEIPRVGASGAIYGVMAAYVIHFARVQIGVLVPFPFGLLLGSRSPFTALLPAWVLMLLYGLADLTGLISQHGVVNTGGGVAHGAHLGGAAVGALAQMLLRDHDRPVPEPMPGEITVPNPDRRLTLRPGQLFWIALGGVLLLVWLGGG